MNYVAITTTQFGNQILAMGNMKPNQYTIQNMIDERLNALCKQELENKIKNIMMVKEGEKIPGATGATEDYIIKYTISYQKAFEYVREDWFFNFSTSFNGGSLNPLFMKG